MSALALIVRLFLYAVAGKIGMVDGFDVDLSSGVVIIHLEAAAQTLAGLALGGATWASSRVAKRFGWMT